jgi:colanic acid biosynthesis glycosyl transferase WcaI
MAKGVPAEKIVLLPNSIDLQFLKMGERNNGFRREQNISSNEFVVMYSGSVALKQGLRTFVEAASEFALGDGVSFFLIGEGPYLGDLKILAEKLRVSTLHFLPLQPRETLPVQLGAADVLVITQQHAVTDVAFPGKLLYYMAAARPILAAVSPDSETGRFVSQHQVGLVVPPENPPALAQAVCCLRENQLEAERLGMNGRRIVEREFDREVVLNRFADHLESLV